MFTVKTSEMLQALKPYEASVTPEDVQKDMTLQVLYTRALFFTEKPASYEVYFIVSPLYDTVALYDSS